MSSNLIKQPYEMILDPTGGGGRAKPVANGKFYVGEIDKDPIANPRTDIAYKDESGQERSLTSPLTLNNSGAFVVSKNDGTIIQPYMIRSIGFSVLIQNARGEDIYSSSHVGEDGNITEIVSNHNMISNFSFETEGSVKDKPDASPRSYKAGDELFYGIFASNDLSNVTYIDGVINGDGSLYTEVEKSEKMNLSTSGVIASTAGADGIPHPSGASVSESSDAYVVTFEMNNTFSVKLEQGSFATRHELLDITGSNDRNIQQRKQFQFKSSRNFDNHNFIEITTDNTNKYFYAPTTEVLPSGRIVTAYTQKNGKLIDPGQDNTPMQINVSVSDDEGVSFSEHVAINKGSGYATSESVIKLNPNDGLLYIFYTSFKGITGWGHSQQGSNENTSSQIEYITSSDGINWSSPVNITPLVKPSSAYFVSIAPTSIGFKNGYLAVPMFYLMELSSDIVESYITNESGVWSLGEIVRRESQTDTLGLSGGEIGFFNYSSGELAALERAYYDNQTLGYRTAMQKLIRKSGGAWRVSGQFETSNSQASIIQVGNMDGFDTEKLFVCAPIGETRTLNGRKNGRLFDCTEDFSNPVDMGSLMLSSNLAYEYSAIALLANGTFMTSWHGQQYKIHAHGWTYNKFASEKKLNAPCHGMKSLPNLDSRDELDTYEGERVYYSGDDFEYIYVNSNFENSKTARTVVASTPINSINANNFDMVFFSTTSEFYISSITGGYNGQVVKCLSLSGSVSVEYTRDTPGVGGNRIKFSDDSTFDKLRLIGGNGVGSGIISFTKTPYGWYSDKTANAN